MIGYTRAFVAALAALLALLGAAMVAAAPLRDPAPRAFTPLQFAAAHPFYTLKIGQTFRITGTLQPWWWPKSAVIAPPGGQTWTWGWRHRAVVVTYGSTNALFARLRRFPLLKAFVPPTADHPLTGRVATFRVRVVPCRAGVPFCRWRPVTLQLEDGGTA